MTEQTTFVEENVEVSDEVAEQLNRLTGIEGKIIPQGLSIGTWSEGCYYKFNPLTGKWTRRGCLA